MSSAEWWYYGWVLLLAVACVVCWFGTLLMLPGNWGIVTCAALFAALVRGGPDQGISGPTIFVLAMLAGAGEVIETFAGTAGTARLGGSRRGMVLSLAGAIGGSIVGVAAGMPIPVVGSAIAAVLGGALGAFAGAMLGEAWKGRHRAHQLAVGRAAFFGRLWGTLGKLVIGAILAVIAIADALF
jgi:hypothetical protein